MPLSVTLCGLPAASSLILRVALRLPLAEGVKVTETVQVAFTASVAGLLGQVFVCAKSAALVPANAMPLIVKGAVPLFVSVTDFAALVAPTSCDPKLKLAGDRLTAGAVPVPLTPTLCGLPAASSLIPTLALRLPVAAGVKLTVIVQVALTASVAGPEGQVFVCAKSAEFVPATAMLLIVSGAVPLFVSVTDCVPLVVPTRWPANVKLDGLTLTAGAAVTAPLLNAFKMLAVVLWIPELTKLALYPSRPHDHWMVPAAKTRAPLAAV